MSLFEKGMTKVGGRQKGVKNKLSHAFLTDLLEHYETEGKAAIRIMFIERPVEYCKMIAALEPRELQIETTAIMEMPDSELESVIEHIRRQISERAQLQLGGGDEPTTIN